MLVESAWPAGHPTAVGLGMVKLRSLVLEAVGRNGVHKIINGLVEKKNQNIKAIIVGAVFVFGGVVALLVVPQIGSRHTILTVMPTATKPATL